MTVPTFPHHAQRVMALVNSLNPDVFKSVDTWCEHDAAALWQFLQLLTCREWLSHYLTHRHASIHAESSLSVRALARHQPYTELITLAAWRTEKTIVRCDMSLFEALQKIGQHHSLQPCYVACLSGDFISNCPRKRLLCLTRGRGNRQPETERQFVMKWIAPVFVNAGDDELLQVVVRSLK